MIDICSNREALKRARQKLDGSVGLVPTMGNLHAGHISLVNQAASENDAVIVTIFVNPKQFGANEDFATYPRTIEQDIELLNHVPLAPHQTMLLFTPNNNEEIFPQNFQTTVQVGKISHGLCAKNRPDHFAGVTTVVYQLFALAKPHKAYFGEKDYQQLAVIKTMVKDLLLDIDIIGCPIMRDSDGLALSSRNNYLNEQDRQKAQTLPKSLKHLAKLLEDKKSLNEFKCEVNNIKQDMNWDYIELRHSDLTTADSLEQKELILLGAYRVGKTRLIDNFKIHL